jgi:hypothetical protein
VDLPDEHEQGRLRDVLGRGVGEAAAAGEGLQPRGDRTDEVGHRVPIACAMTPHGVGDPTAQVGRGSGRCGAVFGPDRIRAVVLGCVRHGSSSRYATADPAIRAGGRRDGDVSQHSVPAE